MLLAAVLLVLGWRPAAWAIDETSRPLQETSDDYLRNVVNELQLLNGFAPSEASSGGSSSLALASTGQPAAFLHRPPLPRYDLQREPPPPPPPLPCREEIEEPPPPLPPPALGFSAQELAAMYRKAIERGSPVKYQSLVNSIDYQPPKLLPVSRPPQPQESQYAYYFYPLQSFHHELLNQYGYRPLPDFKHDSAPAESTKKETSTMNPILVGISSFLGMALFFILSLFVYPRFMHYMHFPLVTTSRTIFENEMIQLTSFVTEAIDYYRKNVQKKSKYSKYRFRQKE